MAGIWYCLKCYKNIGDLEYCPLCGAHRLGDMVHSKQTKQSILSKLFDDKKKKHKKPIFSEEECFLYGIHPDDKIYRKVMELNILSKNYK